MEKRLFFVVLFLVFVFSAYSKNYYVATKGNDTTGVGTIDLPFHTIIRAQQNVVAGDTVFVRGGIYKMSSGNISQKFATGPYAVVHYLSKSGTSASRRICYWAYPGEHPIF